MKSMNIEKVKYFDPKELSRLADNHVRIMNRRVTQKGQDADGKRFPNYTEKYEELKSSGFKGKSGKRMNITGIRGAGLSRQVNPPDFRLRGLTMKNLRRRKVGRDYYEIGWDGEAALIVEGQMSRGRDIASGIPDDEFNVVLRSLGKIVEREHKKIKSVTITVGK